MSEVLIFEILSEYTFWVGAAFCVKGRITKEVGTSRSELYRYEISHHCGKEEIYYPTSVSAVTFEQTQKLLFDYAKTFKTDSKLEENEDY
jgi:hypothetical protein